MERNITNRIETERLILNPLHQDDARELFAYRADPEVSRYQGWLPSGIEEVAEFISTQSAIQFGQAGTWCQLAIRSKETGQLIGDFGVSFPEYSTSPIEFGISLSPVQQRHGYAKEVMKAAINLAFQQWGYRRIIASIDPRNTSSVALFRSLGFREEAHHVESYYFRGEWVDDLIFALLAREWPACVAVDEKEHNA